MKNDAGGYGVRDKDSPRGEVLIGGSIIADGYFKCQSDEEANAFFLDPNGKKWFRTGDIGQVNLVTNTISLIDRWIGLILPYLLTTQYFLQPNWFFLQEKAAG